MLRFMTDTTKDYECIKNMITKTDEKVDKVGFEDLFRNHNAEVKTKINAEDNHKSCVSSQHDLSYYSPSEVRRARAKTVPLLPDIHEDMILYSSKWTLPTLTKKQRRHLRESKSHRTTKQQHILKNADIFVPCDFHSPRTSRKLKMKLDLETLQETDQTDAEQEGTSCTPSHGGFMYRPRAWSE